MSKEARINVIAVSVNDVWIFMAKILAVLQGRAADKKEATDVLELEHQFLVKKIVSRHCSLLKQ